MNPLVLKPRVSEKAYALSENSSTYVFDIPANANKHSIAQAVAKQFKVSVVKVRIASSASKSRRSYARGKFTYGKRPGFQKAYVTLKEGDKLPFFASEEETKPAKEKGGK